MTRQGLVIAVGILIAGCPISPSNQTAPEAFFASQPMTGNPPLVVQFTDESVAGSSPIRAWSWNFGDGTTSVERNPKHTYYAARAYDVSLTVTTAVGASNRKMAGYVQVTEPTIVEGIDAVGGVVGGAGARIEVPKEAFTEQVVIGIAPGEGDVPIRTSENEALVSEVYTITQNYGDLRVDVRTPLSLTIDFAADMVPEAGRNGTNLQIVVQTDTGIIMPILGTVEGSTLVASLAGLPDRASYGVVYRPQALMVRVEAGGSWLGLKSPMSYTWPVNAWRICYTVRTLQELTALRVGNFENLSAYNRRNYSQTDLERTLNGDETLDGILDIVAKIHATWKAKGFISPALIASPDGTYTLILDNLKTSPDLDYENLREVTFATSLFGSIVVDPAQLIAISMKNVVSGDADQAQEMDFVNAFSQEFFRTIFRGYDYPKLTQASATDFNPNGTPRSISFAQGLEDGLAIEMGQANASVAMARSLGNNEYSSLGLPPFAPWSSFVPAYSYSTQEFIIYLVVRLMDHSPAVDPLVFVADSYEGILELIRMRSNAAGVVTYADAMRAVNVATDIALQRSIDVRLSDVYWDYIRARAFENTPGSMLRPSDAEQNPYTFKWDRFDEDSVLIQTFTAFNTPATLSYENYPQLRDVDPLSTRAILLVANGVEGELEISTNAYDWQPDADGKTLRAIVYMDDMSAGYDIRGVELTAADSQITLPGFGDAEAQALGKALFGRVVVLFCNVTLEQQYSLWLTAQVKGSESEEAFGTLFGLVTSDGSNKLPGVTVVVKKRVDGTLLGETETDDFYGGYLFQDLPVGDVEITFSKPGYKTQTINSTIMANQGVRVDVTMVPSG